jgi:hypothetical protein
MTTEQQIKERRLAKLRKRSYRQAIRRRYKNSVDAARYKIMKRITGPDGYTTEFTKPFLLYLKRYQAENPFEGYEWMSRWIAMQRNLNLDIQSK